jgi:hypothetical protein
MATSLFPQATIIRGPIETFVLKIRDPNTGELKPPSEWPGTYTLPNGTRIPAVFVAGAQQVPSDWNIQGIECVIQDVPEVDPIATTLNGVIVRESWKVRFTNYGSNKGTIMPLTLQAVSYRLACLYSQASQVYQYRTSVTFENLTATVRIHDLRSAIY